MVTSLKARAISSPRALEEKEGKEEKVESVWTREDEWEVAATHETTVMLDKR